MAIELPRWARGPHELIQHGLEHMEQGQDFDRRIALISFDNAIEIAITTYLKLHPAHRHGKTYKNDDVDKWLRNYHSKMEFFREHAECRVDDIETFHQEVIYFHSVRNDMYHSGKALVPEQSDLEGIRDATITIFSILFEVDEELLQQPAPPAPESIDIDEENSLTAQTEFLRHYIEFERMMRTHLVGLGTGRQQTRMSMPTMWKRYVSDSGHVPDEYNQIVQQMNNIRNQIVHGEDGISKITRDELEVLTEKIHEISEYVCQNSYSDDTLPDLIELYGDAIRKDVSMVRIVHKHGTVLLEITQSGTIAPYSDESVMRIDLSFIIEKIIDGMDEPVFSTNTTPQRNSLKLINELDPYTLLMIADTNLFTPQGAEEIAAKFHHS